MNPTIADILVYVLPVLAVIAGAVWRYYAPRVPAWARERLALASREVEAVFYRVKQTYVDAKREASADGRLTEEERREALRLAMEELRAAVSLRRLGEALARIFGIGGEVAAESWLERELEYIAARDKERRKALEVADKLRPLS